MHKADMAQHLRSAYADRFGVEPEFLSYAPGRLEVLGNHTDYNQGLALTAAIDRGIYCAIGQASDSRVTLHALDLNDSSSYDLKTHSHSESPPWSQCIRGLTDIIESFFPLKHGFNAIFKGDLPIGSGLSSSAAFILSAAEAIKSHYGLSLSPKETAQLCQRAEQRYSGVQCGLLDPLSIVCAKKDHLTLIDFKSLEVRNIPFPKNYSLLICTTHRTHTLSESGYNDRRESCATAVFELQQLGAEIKSLSDMTMEDLAAHSNRMPELLVNRASHVIGENDRVQQTVAAIKHGDMKTISECLFNSHQSSVDNFENSSPEQDTVVDMLKNCDGIHGARLSGGGFGGSVAAIVDDQQAPTVIDHLKAAYEATYKQACRVFVLKPQSGCELI